MEPLSVDALATMVNVAENTLAWKSAAVTDWERRHAREVLVLVAEVRRLRDLMAYRQRVYDERCAELETVAHYLDAIWQVARTWGYPHADSAGLAEWLRDRMLADCARR